MSKNLLHSHKNAWETKPILKQLYLQWYEEITQQFKPGGVCLEIGGGTGNFKEYYPNTICTDIVELPWLDLIASAETLPFKEHIFSNIILFDVLHHIENPSYFFSEALRVLDTKGRLIIMEPYISAASWPIYHFIHPEPVNFKTDPLAIVPPQKGRKPFDANQAIASQLFYRSKNKFQKQFPQFSTVHKKRSSFIVYPLSGGFDRPSLLPDVLVSPLLACERFLQPLAALFAFRTLIVLEKISNNRN